MPQWPLPEKVPGTTQGRQWITWVQWCRGQGLTQLATIGSKHQGDMGIVRGWQAQGPLQEDLAGGGDEQVGAAYHPTDVLPGIVKHHRQVIGMDPIGPADHEIAHALADHLTLGPLNPVAEPDLGAIGAQAQDPRSRALWGVVAAGSGIDWAIGPHQARGGHLSAAAAAGVGEPRVREPSECLLVGRGADALMEYLAVPVQPEGIEVVQDLAGGTRDLTYSIEILHANKPGTTRGAGVGEARHGGDE